MNPGQQLALEQLRRIEAARPGAVSVMSVDASAESLRITLSIDCRGFPKADGGIPLRERERFRLTIPPGFPFKPPSVWTPHQRWAGVEHVQWKSYLCLYLAPELEWDASDGMFGFVDRLLRWVKAAAVDELDPAGGPIHPPAVYSSSNCPMIIPRADAPAFEADRWWGFARMHVFGDHRRDLTEWCRIKDAVDARSPGDVLAPAVLLSDPLPWEYPRTLVGLLLELVRRGVPTSMLFSMMNLGSLLHEEQHVYIVVGSPSRGVAGGQRLQHLAVWRFRKDLVDAFYATIQKDEDTDETEAWKEARFDELLNWAVREQVAVEWCPVREARAEVTRSRDEGAPVSIWAGKRAAIWGCGALGGAVAEHLVRAGVRELSLRDNADVAPGLLVRQNFEDGDLGIDKATALADRLLRIAPDLEVVTETVDLAGVDRGASWDDQADVVFDLTASQSVAMRMELNRIRHPGDATIVGMSISHDANHGLVVVASPDASGAVVDLRRKAKLTAARSRGLMLLFGERKQIGIELAGDVALEAADDLLLGASLGGASGDVVACSWVVGHADEGDAPERAVGGAVATAVEPVTLVSTR